MISVCDFVFYMSIVVFMMMLYTKAYKKSYSTAVIITVLPITVWFNKEHIEYISNIIYITISTLLLIRAIINNKVDTLIKRK